MNDISAKPIPLAPLDRLKELLPDLPAAKERRELGAALAKACEAIRTVKPFADGLDDAAALLAVCAGALGEDRSIVLASLDALSALAAELEAAATPDALDHVRFAVSKQLPAEMKTLHAAVGRAWRAHVRANLAGMAPLGEVLSRIPSTAKLGQKFRALGNEVAALEQSQKPAGQRLACLQSLLDRRQVLIDQLSEQGIDAEVVRFLQDIAAGWLPLSRLTETVRQWLERAGALGVFRVGWPDATSPPTRQEGEHNAPSDS